MKKIFFIFYICLFLLIKIKTINDVLELGKIETCTIGHLIFNSANTKVGEKLYFEIKSKSITDEYINYYFFDNIEDELIINENNYELYQINITNLIDKEDGLYKVYSFEITKNLNEYEKNIKGNYLMIFYYSDDNLAEISSIIKTEEKNEENEDEEFDENYYYYFLLLIVVIVIIIIFCKKDKKKKNTKTQNAQDMIIYNLQMENQQIEREKNYQEMQFKSQQLSNEIAFMNLQAQQQKEKMIYKNRINDLEGINRRQSKKLEFMEQNRVTIKFSKDSDRLEIEDEQAFKYYIQNLKNQHPFIPDVIIATKGKINTKNIMHVTFVSDDQIIKCIAICKKTDIFNSVVNKIYETKPEFKEHRYHFLGNGMIFSEYKSFEENNIKDGTGITLNRIDE